MTDREEARQHTDGGSAPAGMPPLTRRIRRAAMWSGGSNLLFRLAGYGITVVVAHLVAPRQFGVFAVALTVHTIVYTLGEFGVSASLAREDQDPDTLGPTATTISVVTSIVIAAAMAVFARPVASALGAPDATDPLRVMALTVVMVGVFATPGAQLVRSFGQKQLFMSNVAGFISGNATLLWLAVAGNGAMAFAWSRVVGQLMTGLVIVAKVEKRYWPGYNSSAARSLLRFGLPFAGANLLNYTLLNADFTAIGRLLGPVGLGIYVLAFNTSSWPSGLVGGVVNSVFMPAFSRVKDNKERLQRALERSTQAVATIAFLVSALTCGLAAPLVSTLYGARWGEAVPALSMLAVYGAGVVISLLFGNVLAGLGSSKPLFLVQVAWLAALVPGMVLGVKLAGILGAAVVHVVVLLGLVMPLYGVMLKRIAGANLAPIARSLVLPLVASVAAGTTAYAVSFLSGGGVIALLLGLPAGACVYLAVVVSVVVDNLPLASRHRKPDDLLGTPLARWWADVRALVAAARDAGGNLLRRPRPPARDTTPGTDCHVAEPVTAVPTAAT